MQTISYIHVLCFQVSITAHAQYFLRKDELPLLHSAYDVYYEDVMRRRAIDAIKVFHFGQYMTYIGLVRSPTINFTILRLKLDRTGCDRI